MIVIDTYIIYESLEGLLCYIIGGVGVHVSLRHNGLSVVRIRGSSVSMFRSGQNLKHLHHAREAIKGKVYAGVLGTDSTCDAGVNVAAVSQAEVNDEIFEEEEEM